MPRHIPESWACEVCGLTFTARDGAVRCEGRDARAILDCPPRGLIVTYDYLPHQRRGDDLFADVYDGTTTTEGLRHRDRPAVHLFRGNRHPDETDRTRAAHHRGGLGALEDTDTTSPTFARAFAFCAERGWPPLIVRNGEIVRFEDGTGSESNDG